MAAQSEIIGNLQISTLGLATYLPDGSRMQVVMPATHGHEAHGIPEHKIVLFWESVKFEGPNSAKEGQRSLARRALEIREVGHTGPTPPLPNTLFNLSDEVDDQVNRTVVQVGPKEKVASRLTLTLGGKIESGPTADFSLDFGPGSKKPTKEIKMPTFVTWTLPLTAASRLEWRELDFDNPAADVPFAPLLPIVTGGGVPRLTVFDVPEDELPGNPTPPEPELGKPVVHFPVYYVLFDRPKERPIPVLERLPVPTGLHVQHGVRAGTCMAISAELG